MCLLPRDNQKDVAADPELSKRLEQSGLEVRYVDTIREALVPDLFGEPFVSAPLALGSGAADVPLPAAQTWLASLQLLAALALLAYVALVTLEVP